MEAVRIGEYIALICLCINVDAVFLARLERLAGLQVCAVRDIVPLDRLRRILIKMIVRGGHEPYIVRAAGRFACSGHPQAADRSRADGLGRERREGIADKDRNSVGRRIGDHACFPVDRAFDRRMICRESIAVLREQLDAANIGMPFCKGIALFQGSFRCRILPVDAADAEAVIRDKIGAVSGADAAKDRVSTVDRRDDVVDTDFSNNSVSIGCQGIDGYLCEGCQRYSEQGCCSRQHGTEQAFGCLFHVTYLLYLPGIPINSKKFAV